MAIINKKIHTIITDDIWLIDDKTNHAIENLENDDYIVDSVNIIPIVEPGYTGGRITQKTRTRYLIQINYHLITPNNK